MKTGTLTLLIVGLLLAAFGLPAAAVVLEGTGHGVIRADNLDAAREEARKAALRDLSLQYEARVNSRDTLENGVVTESHLTVDSRASARNVQIVDERRVGNMLRVTLRADMSAATDSCPAEGASRLRKRVAVTGFALEQPEQARHGRLDDAGAMLPQALVAGLRQENLVQVLTASSIRLFGNLADAPTSQRFDNRLSNVVQVARELDAQFVVGGVIRDMGLEDPSAWGSSVTDRLKRGIGTTSKSRRFVADLMIFDGFSGSPVYQQRFSVQGLWDAGQGASTGFGSPGFLNSDYGQQVGAALAEMQQAIVDALACQPFMARIIRVEGPRVTLSAGATSGLRPGDELHLYRSHSHFDSMNTTPELRDADTRLTLNNVHPEFSNGRIPQHGGIENFQRDDIAIVW